MSKKSAAVDKNNHPLDLLSLQMFANIPNVINYHFSEGNMRWQNIIFLSVVHIAAIMGVFRIQHCSAETLLWAYSLWPISIWGITVGVHRLWSHRAYEAHFLLRLWLMLTNSIANQGSIYSWAINHRLHHAYAETGKLVMHHNDDVRKMHHIQFIALVLTN